VLCRSHDATQSTAHRSTPEPAGGECLPSRESMFEGGTSSPTQTTMRWLSVVMRWKNSRGEAIRKRGRPSRSFILRSLSNMPARHARHSWSLCRFWQPGGEGMAHPCRVHHRHPHGQRAPFRSCFCPCPEVIKGTWELSVRGGGCLSEWGRPALKLVALLRISSTLA